MKNIYIFSFLTRIFMAISFLFAIYLGINDCIINGSNFKNIALIAILFLFLVLVIYWQWTVGIFVDKKRGIFIFSFHMNKSKNLERLIIDIKSIEIEREKILGFNFIVSFKNGYKEKIFYRFYRISILEKSQFKRIKRKLNKLNKVLNNK